MFLSKQEQRKITNRYDDMEMKYLIMEKCNPYQGSVIPYLALFMSTQGILRSYGELINKLQA